VIVAQPRLFKALVRKAIKSGFGGNVSKAAKAIRISQSQLSRIYARGITQLRISSVPAVGRLFTDQKKPILDCALLGIPTIIGLQAYGRWLGVGQRSARDLARPYRPRRNLLPSVTAAAFSKEVRAHLKTIDALRTEFRELFDVFDSFLLKRRHTAYRAALAHFRILDGLFEFEPSGGMERPWIDLSKSEMRRFLRAGITRETIMLGRSADLQRAQEIGLLNYPQTADDWAHWRVRLQTHEGVRQSTR
jgi:hypothetical protein